MNSLVRRVAVAMMILASFLVAAPAAAQAAKGPATLADVPGPVLADPATADESYRHSVHARPGKTDPARPNAACRDCHGTDTVPHVAPGSPEAMARRLADPPRCGKCHEEQLREYAASVHGAAVLGRKDAKGAVCSDCHNPHGVDRVGTAAARLRAAQACATCHKANAASFADPYHRQVAAAGATGSAPCFGCHGKHGIQPSADPRSKVNRANRLATCRACHGEAAAGLASFQLHDNAHDFARHPQIWVAVKLVVGVLAAALAFFWVHLPLWLYRELKEGREAAVRTHVQVARLRIADGRHVRRFGPLWRLGHLVSAVTLMLLTLSGMALLHADTAWAQKIIELFGGPAGAGVVHRANAVLLAIVVAAHLGWLAAYPWRHRGTFRWNGPDSLLPTARDGRDVVAMFRWFLGKGARPQFDRWTYWEKFDYWAPLWGVAIVAASGFVLWFPGAASGLLPGWMFNVAAIVHAEQALLAAVFLFTVHFFNAHFRPGRFPFDDVMFTGSMPLERFAREHALQYRRLLESGELSKYLVDAPSPAMQFGSRVLGFALVAFGLVLLLLIANGFSRNFLH